MLLPTQDGRLSHDSSPLLHPTKTDSTGKSHGCVLCTRCALAPLTSSCPLSNLPMSSASTGQLPFPACHHVTALCLTDLRRNLLNIWRQLWPLFPFAHPPCFRFHHRNIRIHLNYSPWERMSLRNCVRFILPFRTGIAPIIPAVK